MDGQNYQYDSGSVGGQKSSGLAIAALVVGIISIVVGCCSPILGIGAGIVAIVLAVLAKRDEPDGRATAGMVCGIVGIVIGVIMWIINIIVMQNRESIMQWLLNMMDSVQ